MEEYFRLPSLHLHPGCELRGLQMVGGHVGYTVETPVKDILHLSVLVLAGLGSVGPRPSLLFVVPQRAVRAQV